MRTKVVGLALLPLLLACAQVQEQRATDPAAAPHASHAHAHDPTAKIGPGPAPAGAAPRWVADAPLRAGMARVRTAADVLGRLEAGHLEAQQVAAQADEIRTAVDFMFAQCRLAPEPDAALHPLLARLIGISAALKEHPAEPAPVADLRAVLTRYAELFEERKAFPAGR